MTTTIVTWANNTPGLDVSNAMLSKAAQMALDGKTDNNPIKEEVETEHIITRTWTTLADAEEWIAFVEQYTPVSATIQS